MSDVQIILRDAAYLLGDLFGVGGDTWQVWRSSGDGYTTPQAPVQVGTITAYVKQVSSGRGQSLIQTGTAQVDERQNWHAIIVSDPVGLRSGDILVSDDRPALTARVVDPIIVAAYTRWRVELIEEIPT